MRLPPVTSAPAAVALACAPRRVLLVSLLAWGLLVGMAVGSAVAAEPGPGFTWTATVGGHSVETTDARDPVRLDPSRPLPVTVRVENLTNAPVNAHWVRLEGRVLGLSFYVYTTRVDLEVPPGGKDDRRFDIELLDLGRQANGLIPSRITLLDPKGEEVAGQDLVVDVQGSLGSVYGTFGIAVALITSVLLAGALWRLSTGRLHPNRWRRGLTMAAPGLGIAFVLTFSLSALRWASPTGELWGILLALGTAVGFAAGYFTPTPGGRDGADEPAEPDDDDDGVRGTDGATDPLVDLYGRGPGDGAGSESR